MESGFKIAVIGLGIIGGSMAYALRGFRHAEIVGCDIDAETRKNAVKNKAVQWATADAGEAIDQADLVILCTYPDSIPKLIEENAEKFKAGAVVTDVCGVKTKLTERICAVLPPQADYVGGHPMAGKEVEGFDNASPELFWMTGFIITPVKASKPESVALIHEMAHYIGATRITQSSPEEHDRVIAYTSDLMHIASSALCLNYPEEMNRAYTAGAFRDCTRVANINPILWTELFIENAENTVAEIDRLMQNLGRLRQAVNEKDARQLMALLETVRQNKMTMQKKEPQEHHVAKKHPERKWNR